MAVEQQHSVMPGQIPGPDSGPCDLSIRRQGEANGFKPRGDAYQTNCAGIDQGSVLSAKWFEGQYRLGGNISGQDVDGFIDAKIENDKVSIAESRCGS